ncbi:MAG: hypothetical protein M1457_02440 [bacterium]|nr:hypothetical protein [bacterium]
MSFWKTVGLVGVAAVLLWLLAPRRSSDVRDASVQEIIYMGQGAQLQNIFSDMFTAFERHSIEAHRKDPSKPIYRLVLSQQGTSDVDMTADPTRFMISVAGGMPPDVIFFDRFALGEWAVRGAFTPLDPFIEADLKAGRADAIRPGGYYKGGLGRVPLQGTALRHPA